MHNHLNTCMNHILGALRGQTENKGVAYIAIGEIAIGVGAIILASRVYCHLL